LSRPNSPRFALIGAAGYVAPRHMAAIQGVDGHLAAACDPHDSVGVLDDFGFDTRFFQEFERFDRHLDKVARRGEGVHYVSICSPNHLHDAHIRFALRNGADAICEKPLVINPWNIGPLEELAAETGRNIWTVLQLREHPTWRNLKALADASPQRLFQLELTTVTARGSWYQNSWKGNEERSGGLASNIGIHFFDALLWIFGPLESSELHVSSPATMSGYLRLERAEIRWFLSIEPRYLPTGSRVQGERSFRSLRVDGDELEFSGAFSKLHEGVYRSVLEGKGCGPSEARPAIELSRLLRSSETESGGVRRHSILRGEP